MTDLSEQPTYNLKVVIQETGVKPDTLRAWERRYGLPNPARSEGRHRLYSERDIDTIHWLVARQEEGLSISRAVKLWKRIEKEGQDPLENMPLKKEQPEFNLPELSEMPTSSVLADMRQAWVEACMNFDEASAENITNQAFALYPAETVCFKLLLAGLSEIGESWYQSNASVQQEHFASALVVRRLNALIAASPPPTRTGTILVGCPPGEDHTLAPLMISLLLRQRGWRVVYLGANVALDRFKATIKVIQPKMVVLTAQLLHTAASLADVANELKELDLPVAFGGRIFFTQPEVRECIPGYYLGDNLQQGIQSIEKILRDSAHAAEVPVLIENQIEEAKATLQHFREQRGRIESRLSTELQDENLDYEYIALANQQIASDIIAALKLGNLNYISGQLEWLRDLMTYRKVPPIALKIYLRTYLQIAKQVMDKRGQPIFDWLTKIIEANGFS
ncbi:MAG: MerR family transcriptional regulator [Anaerolineales bacterium]|nr:MerR family transcriptional regulator [Anaerolineales bacterium]